MYVQADTRLVPLDPDHKPDTSLAPEVEGSTPTSPFAGSPPDCT